MDDSAERLSWLRLALAEGLSPLSAARLVERVGGAAAAAEGRLQDLIHVVGMERAPGLSRELGSADPERVERAAVELGQRLLTPADPGWPAEAFLGLADPPRVLFLRGEMLGEERPAVAVVGTRRATPYGLRVAHSMAGGLAERGIVVVSGMAMGIDAEAHRAALEAGARGGGGTVAVLGCGLDVRYPVENLGLKERVAKEGCLLSEHPPGTLPLKHHFPRRNRIVAALSAATVVVEGPVTSGALITARIANDLGRSILAVPGPVGKESHAGCHALIKRGEAGLCEGVDDVLIALGIAVPSESGGAAAARGLPPPPAGAPLVLWSALDQDDVLDADTLCRRTGIEPGEALRALTGLELTGRIVRVPGLGYRRLA